MIVIVKMTTFGPLELAVVLYLISRKIWVTEKILNFHTVSVEIM